MHQKAAAGQNHGDTLMPDIYVSITEEEKVLLEKKAHATGLPVSKFVRCLLSEFLGEKENKKQVELLKAIRSLVPTIAEALGRVEKYPPEGREVLAQTLMKKWESERGKK